MSTAREQLAKEVTQLVWPAATQGLLSTIIIFTDRLILGRYDDSALASMQVSGALLWSLFSLFGAFGVGVLAIVGRAIGSNDARAASRAMSSGLVISFVLGAVLGGIGYGLRFDIAVLIVDADVTSPAILDMATTYLGIVFLAAPATLAGSTLMVAFQAAGDTRTPMWITLACGLVNLGVSYLLVFGVSGLPKMGVAGAAYGTISAGVLQGVIGLWLLRLGRAPLELGLPSRQVLGPIFKISGPAFSERFIFHVGYMTFVALIGRLGDQALTAHQALMAIESLGFIGANAFGIAASALVAQKMGAGLAKDAQRATHLSARLGTIALAFVGLFFALLAPWLVGLFSDDPHVVSLGSTCLRIAAVAQPIMAITDVYAGALRGAGDTRTPLVAALGGALCVRLGACYFLAIYLEMGLIGIWIGSTLDWFVRAAWLIYAFKRGRWQNIVISVKAS